MTIFEGADAISKMVLQLQKEFGLAMSEDELFKCAAEPSCLQVWTTASGLMDKTVRITDVIGSWNMTEIGVGNVCHVNIGKDVAFCHVPSDAYKTGISWLALGVSVDAPHEKPLPVAVRCHDMGPSHGDAPCHLLAGNEFMAARFESIDRYTQIMQGDDQHLMTGRPSIIVPLGWCSSCYRYDCLLTGGFVNGAGLQCLDVAGGTSVDGAMIQSWSCIGNANQNWAVTGDNYEAKTVHHIEGKLKFGGDNYGIIGQGAPTHCLDVPGGNLVAGQTMWLWTCDNSISTQNWWVGPDGLQLKVGDEMWCLERPDNNDGSLPTLQLCPSRLQEATKMGWNVIAKEPDSARQAMSVV
jgi:hypothetical protein